ncbi:MAG: MaoC family dehydratase [Pseudomonadota bacterium]
MSQEVRRLVIERTLRQADFTAFAALSGDDNPIHVDADFAARTRFGRTVAHGVLLCSILRGLAARLVPGGRQVAEAVTFLAPTYADEPMRFEAALAADDGRMVRLRLGVTRIEDGTLTCAGEATLRRGKEGAP